MRGRTADVPHQGVALQTFRIEGSHCRRSASRGRTADFPLCRLSALQTFQMGNLIIPENTAGFEPISNGFAIRLLRPLGNVHIIWYAHNWVEGQDLNLHLTESQSAALPLSYLPHICHKALPHTSRETGLVTSGTLRKTRTLILRFWRPLFWL